MRALTTRSPSRKKFASGSSANTESISSTKLNSGVVRVENRRRVKSSRFSALRKEQPESKSERLRETYERTSHSIARLAAQFRCHPRICSASGASRRSRSEPAAKLLSPRAIWLCAVGSESRARNSRAHGGLYRLSRGSFGGDVPGQKHRRDRHFAN